MLLEKPENYLQKNESRSLSYTIKWKWTQNWLKTNVRSDTRKLEENINHILFDISLSNIFFLDWSPQARTTKAKINQQNNQIRSDQSLSRVRLFATPWIAARQASLSITNSRSSLRLTSIESVMPSSHLILCRPLLLLPPIPPSIRVFSSESTLCMRWRMHYWTKKLLHIRCNHQQN